MHVQTPLVFGEFRDVAKSVGCPGSFHALRHYVPSGTLAESGGNEFLTAQVLAHARQATTTDIYGDLLGEEARGVSAAIERRLAGSQPQE